jgi:tetratricopeptide (TPR) repeat protein
METYVGMVLIVAPSLSFTPTAFVDAYSNLGVAHQHLGTLVAAAVEVEGGTGSGSSGTDTRAQTQQERHLQLAIHGYSTAVRLAPAHANACFNLGALLYGEAQRRRPADGGMAQEAVAYFKQAAAADPGEGVGARARQVLAQLDAARLKQDAARLEQRVGREA